MKLHYKVIFIIALCLANSCNRESLIDPVNNDIPPLAPTDLQVFGAFDGQIGIEWRKNSEPNINGYKIFRSINKPDNFKLIRQTSDNYFIEYYLDYDSTYYYKISAVNSSNFESPQTNFVSAKPINYYSPLAPNSVRINARNWSSGSLIYLYWIPPSDKDIKGYEIYRSSSPGFNADLLHLVAFTSQNFFADTKDINILTKYYYRIVAVDKGNLKSPATLEVNDVILNSPKLVYPVNNTIIKEVSEFRFQLVSLPAKYKLVIQSNEIYGTIKEIDLISDKIDQEISVNLQGLSLESSKTYSWRVYTFTNSEIDPNSYSDYFTFTFNPFK